MLQGFSGIYEPSQVIIYIFLQHIQMVVILVIFSSVGSFFFYFLFLPVLFVALKIIQKRNMLAWFRLDELCVFLFFCLGINLIRIQDKKKCLSWCVIFMWELAMNIEETGNYFNLCIYWNVYEIRRRSQLRYFITREPERSMNVRNSVFN